MRHLFLFTTMPPCSSSSAPSSISSKPIPNPNLNPHNSLLCTHSPSATLDLLILILVLFSGTFLIVSYFSYIFNSLSLLFPLSQFSFHFPNVSVPYALGFLLFFFAAFLSVELCCGSRSRKCGKPGCKGLKKAMEFDLQLQTEECVRSGFKDFDKLPWKGGSEGNPDYECLRAELRKMAPPNGRAVLLFRLQCGCPVAKLQGWGPRRGKWQKK